MRILLGMSGGLDSTYAAVKLKEQGHEVEGAVILMHEYTDVASAKEAAESLGIPLHVIDARATFCERVQASFISEYKKGRTPNPCVVCNSEVKFRTLFDYAKQNGFDKIATGHYAKIVTTPTPCGVKHTIANANDAKKDQTYMLWRLPEDVLENLMLPLAEEQKSDIREITKREGIFAADREESQEICFVPDGDYAAFIEERTEPSEKGCFIDSEGRILGEHQGIIRYTVGQRKGLGIAMGTRVFVTKIDPVANTITLSPEDSYKDMVTVSEMNFVGICEPKIGETLALSVKLRYLAPKVKATVTYLGEGRAEIKLDSPVRAVTPGQSAVLYDGDVLVCGGFID